MQGFPTTSGITTVLLHRHRRARKCAKHGISRSRCVRGWAARKVVGSWKDGRRRLVGTRAIDTTTKLGRILTGVPAAASGPADLCQPSGYLSSLGNETIIRVLVCVSPCPTGHVLHIVTTHHACTRSVPFGSCIHNIRISQRRFRFVNLRHRLLPTYTAIRMPAALFWPGILFALSGFVLLVATYKPPTANSLLRWVLEP
jgi:hypothetical protein